MSSSGASLHDETHAVDLLLNYEVQDEVGRGGTAIVYSARCRRGRLRNRVVALKKINTPNVVPTAHLKTSTKLHQTLFHPSIVSLLSVFTHHATQFHVLEYCPNGTLMQRVRQSLTHSLTEPELRGVVRSLLDGLLYLRKELIIHRDIKPSNILISGDWRVKLADFGLAVRVESETTTVMRSCGTPGYKSPQQVAHESYGFETDLWSLGAVMVTCLTGVHAFSAPSVDEIDRKVSCAEYTLPDWLTSHLRDLVSRLLEVNRTKRIPLIDILSHPFLTHTLPVVPLDRNIPHLTVTEATPLNPLARQAHSSKMKTAILRKPKYPQSHFKAATPSLTSNPEDFGLRAGDSPCRSSMLVPPTVLECLQPRQPRQPLPSAPFSRRVASLPITSFSTANSSFLALKSEDTQARRVVSDNKPGTGLLSIRTPPALITNSDPASSDDRSLLLPDPVLYEFKAHAHRKLNPLLTMAMARQAVRDLESLSDVAGNPRSAALKASRPLAPPSPSSSTSPRKMFVPLVKRSVVQDDQDDISTGNSSSFCDSPSRAGSCQGLAESAIIKRTACFDSSSLVSAFKLPKQAQALSSSPLLLPVTQEKHASTVPGLSTFDQPNDEFSSNAPTLKSASALAPVSSSSGKPVRFNTLYLSPQTHKVLKGQITVLPSKSLLVDLREGERRKGRKGDEVFVINPDGGIIKVYSAPHLSSPCCLAEPCAEYTFESLPRAYWNQYADAGKVVSILKQRVPKLVLYKPEGRCTLMANEPYGDIEVVIPAPGRKQDNMSSSSTTTLKLRLRQDRRTLEVSRYMSSNSRQTSKDSAYPTKISPSDTGLVKFLDERKNAACAGTQASVASKKMIPVVRAGYEMELVDEGFGAGAEWTLDEAEAAGVKMLRAFLATVLACRTVEDSEVVESAESEGRGTALARQGSADTAPIDEETCVATAGCGSTRDATVSSTTSTSTGTGTSQGDVLSSLARMGVAPRPARFPRSRASSAELQASGGAGGTESPSV